MQRAPGFGGKETLCQMILAMLKQFPLYDAIMLTTFAYIVMA
jgi:hypothetical protein